MLHNDSALLLRPRIAPEAPHTCAAVSSRRMLCPNQGYVREFSKVDVLQRGALNEIVR